MFYPKFLKSSLFVVIFLSQNGFSLGHQLPGWLKSNPGFQKPKIMDSIKIGNGSITTTEKQSLGWLIHLNDKLGYGAELDLDLKLDPNAGEFFMIAGWPVDEKNFKEVKLFVGDLKGQKIHVPDTKSFLMVYSASGSSTSLSVTYKRYGVSYEPSPTPTESPVKKETLYDIQLKGKHPNSYTDLELMAKLKEAIKVIAKVYCTANNIKFNNSMTAEEMVLINRISFCPFEWPDREICVSVQHSVFVSGIRVQGLIMDYELTSEHLKDMWDTSNLEEIKKLGIAVYQLPKTSSTILWWSLMIGLVVASSLVGIFVFWGVERYSKQMSFRAKSGEFEKIPRKKKPRPRLAEHQQIPAFMLQNDIIDVKKFEDSDSKAVSKNIFLQDDRKTDTPLKNYFGSLLFNNRGYEDDEEIIAEFQRK